MLLLVAAPRTLLVAAGLCSNTDGSAVNPAGCTCEDVECTTQTGLFCSKSFNTCSRVRSCLVTDGTASNEAECMCGSSMCFTSTIYNIDTGFFCYADISQCSKTAFTNLCPVRDGSAANSAACKCGKEECTEATGLICYSIVGGGSCRKSDFGPFGFSEIDSGSCTDLSGRNQLDNIAVCNSAAVILGYDATQALNLASSDGTQACSQSTGATRALYFNPPVFNAPTVCTEARQCICLAAQLTSCSVTDGTAPNSLACKCGTSSCFSPASTGMYCNATVSKCGCAAGRYTKTPFNNYLGQTTDRSGICYQCDGGKYADQTLQTSCKVCVAGSYQDEKSSSNCKKCSAGRFNQPPTSANPNPIYTSIEDCIACPFGKSSREGASRCYDCPVGTFSNSTVSCQECPSGWKGIAEGEGENREAKCSACIKGQYQSEDGQPFCFPCNAGTYQSESGQQQCTDCPANSFSDQGGQSSCKDCDGIDENSKPGKTFCSKCDAGKFMTISKDCDNCGPGTVSTYGKTECTGCAAGYYSNEKCTECIACAIGFYSDQPLQSSISSCKGCPLGKYLTLTSAKGSVNCFSCAPGRYAKESHSTSCEHCPEGWLQEAEGQPNCSRPVAGKIAAGGASSVKISPGWFATDCDEDTGVCKTQKVCEAGSKGNKERTRCDPCEAGTTSFQGSISCIPCSKGKFAASEGSTCAKCPSGFYQSNDDTPSVDCVACPQGWGPVLDEGMNEVDGSALCRDLNWKKAEDCTKDQYLDNRFLNNPSNWSCVTCPQGGACNGLATWSTLGPLFGWWKVPESERPSEQFMFT